MQGRNAMSELLANEICHTRILDLRTTLREILLLDFSIEIL